MTKLNLTDLELLAIRAVTQAKKAIPGATDDEKRQWATQELNKQVEIYDDYLPVLGKWAGRAAGAAWFDYPIVNIAESWLCEQIIRLTWARLTLEGHL